MENQKELFDVLMQYREMLSHIEMQRRSFKRCEYTTTYRFTNIDEINEVMAALKDALDSASQLLNEIQGDVAIQNYMTSMVHLKSSARVLDTDGESTKGDARDIVDVKRLDELVALLGSSIAYYNANLKQAGMFDTIHTIMVKLDAVFSSIVQAAYHPVACTTPPSVGFFKEWSIDEANISMTLLDKQKYFTAEEQAEIDEQERAKREAIEKAEAEARRAQELVEANAEMVLLIKEAGGLDWEWSGDEAEVVSDAVKAIKHIAGDTAEVMKNLDGIRTSPCISFVTKDEPIATKVFVNFAKFMSWIAGKKVIVYDTDAYSNIENLSYDTLPPGMLAHLEEEL